MYTSVGLKECMCLKAELHTGPKVALAGAKLVKVLRKGRVLAVRAEDAGRVVHGSVGHKLHILHRAHVLSIVHRLESVLGAVVGKAHLATREARHLLVGARRLAHLPRKQAVRDRDDLVARTHLHLVVGREEGEHRVVGGVQVVRKGEAVGNGLLHHVVGQRADAVGDLLATRAKEVAVATGHVAVAHDVAEHHDVLRLGDDRLGVAGKVTCERGIGKVNT